MKSRAKGITEIGIYSENCEASLNFRMSFLLSFGKKCDKISLTERRYKRVKSYIVYLWRNDEPRKNE